MRGDMNELALFAEALVEGILAASLLRWRTVCAVENTTQLPPACSWARQNDGCLEPFPVWDDVRTFDGKEWKGCVGEVVSGGIPLPGHFRGWKRCEELAENAPDFGEKWHALSVRSTTDVLCSWKTLRSLCDEDSTSFSADLAELGFDAVWGLYTGGGRRYGAPHRRERFWLVGFNPNPSHAPVESENPDNRIPTTESLFGTVEGSQKRGRKVAASGIEGSQRIGRRWCCNSVCFLRRCFAEALHGMKPIGWTDWQSSAMDKFRQWRSLHGIS